VPTYEYRCKDCGTELEVVQAFTDDALTTCDACGGALRKVFGSVGISFKGSGFYKNDSRGAAKGSGSGDSGDGAKKAEPAANGSSDKSSSDTSSSDKSSSDKASSDKGSSGKGSSDKGSSDKGSSKPAPAASTPASS
jgi:putative FmdB family regulatory protein